MGSGSPVLRHWGPRRSYPIGLYFAVFGLRWRPPQGPAFGTPGQGPSSRRWPMPARMHASARSRPPRRSPRRLRTRRAVGRDRRFSGGRRGAGDAGGLHADIHRRRAVRQRSPRFPGTRWHRRVHVAGHVADAAPPASSASSSRGHVGADWLSEASGGPILAGPDVDPRTGKLVVISVVPVPDGVGFVAAFLDLDSLGTGLADRFARSPRARIRRDQRRR